MSWNFSSTACATFLFVLVGVQSGILFAQEAEQKPAAPPKAVTVLTWAECIKLATDNNPDLEASKNNVLNADAVRKASYSNFYPQISASISGGRSYQEVKNPGLPSTSDYSNNFSAQLSLSQMIFDGFRTEANVDSSKAQLNYAFASLNSQKAVLSYNLKTAFAQLLYAQNLVESNAEILKLRQDNEDLVSLQYSGGTADQGSWMISKANREQAQFNYNQALRNRDVSELQLLTVIGKLDIPRPVAVQGELITSLLPVSPDFQKLALLTPAYFQRQAQVDASRAGLKYSESGWWPTISANVSGGNAGSAFFPNTTGASGGISVSYSLFSGGSTYFDVAASQANLMQTLAQLRSGTNQAALTLAQAFKGYVDAVDNVRVQKIQLDANKKRYEIYEGLYRIGQVSFQDFNSNTDSYVGQQTAYIASQRDAVIAEANWEQARGLGAIP